MAVTKTSLTWSSSSSTTQTVPFEVIAAGDIDVYVEGVLQLQQNTTSTADATHPQVVSGEITQGTALTNYTVASNNGSITFNANLSVGNFVVIERTTDDTLLETFTSGSTVRARDLNSAFERVLFIAQEGYNVAEDESLQVSDDEDDSFDAKDKRISKVANATDDDDAVNRAQLGKVITDDLVEGEGIDLTDATGGTNSNKQVTISAELSTSTNPGVVKVNATTPIVADYAADGDLNLRIDANTIDLDKIKNDDIINNAEQEAGSPSPADTNIFTALAAKTRHDTLIQTGTPAGSTFQTGKFWYQNDEDKTFYVWDGDSWEAVTSGGAFTRLDKVIYVDAINGDDTNNGHRISTPKASIKAAVEAINADSTFGDGSVVLVAPGVYQEEAPIDIEKRDVAVIGASIRNVIVHPTSATETESLFRVNSGSYLSNMTFTGMKASGTRGEVGSLWTDSTYGLPATQGWNVSFFPNAMIVKSPYIQNCTNFSDSEIDNDNLDFYAGSEDKGRAGDLDSGMTGGGLLIDGSTPHTNSPLRSIVADSYTHVGLDGPGIFVTNNGYCQVTSSYAFFNHFHIACLNGGQANLAASTTDFGRYSLVADGKSTSAIFTATTTATAADGSETFTIGAPTAGSNWHGSATRPQDNMVVEIGGNIYPVLSAVANGSGWDVTISRPNTADRTENLGLDGAVNSGSTAEFFLRSMIASSGHTMEYVGSGTDYSALPENGGVPNDDNQVVERNDGKVWTAITDHNGTFKVGETFEVNQQTGFVSIPAGALSVSTLLEDLNTNGNEIKTITTDQDIVLNPNGTGVVNVSTSKITNVVDPTDAQDAATKNFVDNLTTSTTAELNILDGATLNTSELNTLDGITASTSELNQLDGKSITTTFTGSNTNDIPTSSAINSYVVNLFNALGGFVAIADETSFPNSNPDPQDGAGTVVSIADAGGLAINGSGVATGQTLNSTTVTINGFPSHMYSETLAAGLGVQVQTTTTEHTYTFHKLIPKDTDILRLSDDVNDFNNRYRVSATAPTTDLDAGDLWFDTTSGKMKVYDAGDSAWEEVQSVGNFFINTISSSSGTGGGSATFNGSAYRFTLSNAPTSAQQLIVSVNGVIQKPNSGTSQPSEGFAIDNNDIIFSDAPATNAPFFIVTIGSSVNIGTPSNNTVDTAQLVDGAVTNAKISSSAAIASSKIDFNNIDVTGEVQCDSLDVDGNADISGDISVSGGNKTIQTTAGFLQVGTSGSNHLAFITNGSERGRLDSAGRLGVGTSSPGCQTGGIHVVHDATEGTPTFTGGEVAIFQRNYNSGQGSQIGIIGGSSGASSINFGDKDDADRGIIQYAHSDDSMRFYANAGERLRLDSSGNVKLLGPSILGAPQTFYVGDDGGSSGAFLNQTANLPIRILTNGTEEARFLAGGGLTFNGDTAQTNALDDYEEGTWSPGVNIGTCTASDAKYIKIGKFMRVCATITGFSDRTTATILQINNVPYASSQVAQAAGSMFGRYLDRTAYTSYVKTNGGVIEFYSIGSGNFAPLQHQHLNNASSLIYLQASWIIN